MGHMPRMWRQRAARPVNGSDWSVALGVTCVVCPGCAFTFDAAHIDDEEGGHYTCPVCERPYALASTLDVEDIALRWIAENPSRALDEAADTLRGERTP